MYVTVYDLLVLFPIDCPEAVPCYRALGAWGGMFVHGPQVEVPVDGKPHVLRTYRFDSDLQRSRMRNRVVEALASVEVDVQFENQQNRVWRPRKV